VNNGTRQLKNATLIGAAFSILAAEFRHEIADSRAELYAVTPAVPRSDEPHHSSEQEYPTDPTVAQTVLTSRATVGVTSKVNRR
jgi:hypothetical protein